MRPALKDSKYCPTCKSNLSVSAFAKNKATRDGLAKQCRGCKKLYQDAWYRKNQKRHYKNVRARINREQEKLSSWLLDYFKTHPCVDCGNSDPRVLEFDHVGDDKACDVSFLVARVVKLERIIEEIAKCEVRCCNCHRIKTIIRGKHRRMFWNIPGVAE